MASLTPFVSSSVASEKSPTSAGARVTSVSGTVAPGAAGTGRYHDRRCHHERARQERQATRGHLASIRKMVVRAASAAGLALTLLASSCTSATPKPSPSVSPVGATHLQLIETEDAQTLDPAL